jgi:hypothetical protein
MCRLTPNCPNPDYDFGMKGCAECLKEASAELEAKYAAVVREAIDTGTNWNAQRRQELQAAHPEWTEDQVTEAINTEIDAMADEARQFRDWRP